MNKPKPFIKAKQYEPKWRGTATERGYDSKWTKLRQWYAKINPLCEQCLKQGRTEAMQDVDHIVPFEGRNDPMRLKISNLQSLCRRCHLAKTRAQNVETQ